MKITRLRLHKGYKRFYDLTIDLGEKPKKIVALIGANGCGKSSVIDGILYYFNSHNQIGSKGTRDYRYHSMNNDPSYNFRNVQIEILNGDINSCYQINQAEKKQNTMVSFRGPYRYNGQLNVTETRAVSDIKTNNYGASTTSDIDEKMEDNYRRLYIKYNKYMNESDSRPSEAKQKIIGDLNTSIKKCLEIEISSLGDIAAAQGSLFFHKPDHPIDFNFNVLSSGEKEVVDIILDLYLRSDDFNDTIFLLDEPDLHINTSIQRKLLIEIDKLINENCQIWIATHSIGFIRAFQDDLKEKCQIIHFQDNKNYASEPITLKPEIMTVKSWNDLFSIPLDDLAHLITPRRIIYCEGKDKPGKNRTENGLDSLIFNKIFGEKHSDTIFVSSGGNTELDQRSQFAISVFSKILPDIEILILKDRDISSGGLTTLEDRDIYLKNNPHNHRVLKRREIENYLFDKEVLKKYCSTLNLDFQEDEYECFVNDINNQNIKDDINKIKNFCNIKTSINPEKFKLNLADQISTETVIFSELEACIFY